MVAVELRLVAGTIFRNPDRPPDGRVSFPVPAPIDALSALVRYVPGEPVRPFDHSGYMMTRHRPLFASARAAIVAILIASLASTAGGAQTISPPVVEYTERASASFQVTNPTLTPLVVVLDVRGFVVAENGLMADVPLDTSRVKVQLSEMSFRLPPRATRTIFYEATADSAPAWFHVIATFTGGRAANGLNLRIELPHVVYLNQRDALVREDVLVRSAAVDTAGKFVRVVVENISERLGRVLEINALGGPSTIEGGAVPLFPRSSREVRLPIADGPPPNRIALRFAGFSMDHPITP